LVLPVTAVIVGDVCKMCAEGCDCTFEVASAPSEGDLNVFGHPKLERTA
jgi:hypothetical protein